MDRVDFKKELKRFYYPSAKEVAIVDVLKMNFLMVDGAGDPNTAQEYEDAVEALYSVSYALKFIVRREKATDYAVMPLEGLWWVRDMRKFSMEDKDAWKWTVMIMQPEYVTRDLVDKALEQVGEKNLRAVSKIRFESLHEGLSAQIMHIGPYSEEESTVQRLHKRINANGYELRGKHHEIYLSDPRKSPPERLKTVIRQPITRV